MDFVALANGAVERGAIQKPTELAPFFKLLSKKPLKLVVEIGTSKGGTFWALCKLAHPKATIISLDLVGSLFSGGEEYRPPPIKVLRAYGQKGQTLHFIRRDSHNPNTLKALKKILGGRKIQFLFIDGDHTYAGCSKDWEMYSPLVMEGGTIAFHDILHHPTIPLCQVEYVWKKLKDKYPITEICDTSTAWGGIGVLEYKRLTPAKVVSQSKGILLDLNPWPDKQPGFIGMGNNPNNSNYAIVHDLEKFPYPLRDNSCHTIIGHFIFQTIQPRLSFKFMDELWRILKPGGQLALSVPYAGSPAQNADPMNINPCTEGTFYFFDPSYPAYTLYKPKPWEIQKGTPQWQLGGNIEVIMKPVK